jgi:predicted RNase H-like nuclease (RuvC/YqgF family)
VEDLESVEIGPIEDEQEGIEQQIAGERGEEGESGVSESRIHVAHLEVELSRERKAREQLERQVQEAKEIRQGLLKKHQLLY